MLTLPEAYVLLGLGVRRKPGDFDDATAIAAAVLMELALRSRIDTDLDGLFILSREPTDEPQLDQGLAGLAEHTSERQHIRSALGRLRDDAERLRQLTLERLCARGIVEAREERRALVFRVKHFPIVRGRELENARELITGVLANESIPSPHEVALVGLASASGILRLMFSEVEMLPMRGRIQQLVRLDLINQQLQRAIADAFRL